MIDIIFLFLVLMALVKGYTHGFIRAIFSVIALVLGLAAAMKLSVMAAAYLQDSVSLPAKWLPVISFTLVFTAVVLLIRMASGLLQKAAEAITLGWLNKLAGIALYLAVYTIIFSVVLFYADKIHLINKEALLASRIYPSIQPMGPAVINAIGFVVPVFKNMFHELEQFFGKFRQ